MEFGPTGRVKREDNQVSQISPACLRIPLILRTVMQHFTDEELLKYSLVNKQWNYEARSVSRNRHLNRARLTSDKPCQDIVQLMHDVLHTNVVLFSGMKIAIDHHAPCDQMALNVLLNPNINGILRRLSWKTFFLSLKVYSSQMKTCPAFLLAKKILQDFCGSFEGLCIDLSFKYADFIEEILQDRQFPRLKNLQFQGMSCPLKEDQKTFIKTLVSRAPKLETLFIKGPVDFSVNLLEQSSAVLAVLYEEVDPLKIEMCPGLVDNLGLRTLKLKYREENFNMERFNIIVPGLLQASRTLLGTLRVNLAFLVNLMSYGVCLETVRNLQIDMNHRQSALFQPRMLRLLKNLDFTRIFPTLRKVNLHPCNSKVSHTYLRQVIEQGSGAWEKTSPDRAVNIQCLLLEYFPTVPQLLTAMFPDTRTLVVNLLDGPAFDYGSIWKHWAGLKQLEIHVKLRNLRQIFVTAAERWRRWSENVDSFFCGIFPQEVVQLREKDEEYLRTVNIVPVMPSLTCLKGLESLRFIHENNGTSLLRHDQTFIFSKVTGLIAFSRCPRLSVIIETNSGYRMGWDHMRNYASVVYTAT